jgi:hypothetical protein
MYQLQTFYLSFCVHIAVACRTDKITELTKKFLAFRESEVFRDPTLGPVISQLEQWHSCTPCFSKVLAMSGQSHHVG